uniref:NADH-ubiquinone oxidoreductase chain 4 n=1 Tax=Jaagichlorella hainangensis TaxID=445995 RepID=A0A6M8UB92_9CHLO|nr:NADH dehydrogenase subunit 4 [Jaagichlorella hainangensis]QKJ84920.1 NADH dehydrogenase subunit 4 [Jaagichlorella hainangensis]
MSLILIILLIPIIGALTVLFISNVNQQLIKVVGLSFSVITFVVSLFLWVLFDNSALKFQFVHLNRFAHAINSEKDIGNAFNETKNEINSFITQYKPDVLSKSDTEIFSLSNQSAMINDHGMDSTFNIILGIDGISLFFIILTTFLIPICLLVAWQSITIYVKEYVIAFLVMESLMIAVFSVLDLLLFYIFFESVLIPMFVIIGVWGSRERKIRAAYQFFLYTLLGSLLMLLAVLLIYFQAGTCSIETLYLTNFSDKRSIILWLAFFASFAVKVPMVPVHIWLPEAHVEAPTAGSVLLAGIMLKLGLYGFIRFSIPMFPFASIYFTPLIYTLSCIAIIYASLTTLRQVDLKKIIAYSSVAHMNFVTLGIFSLSAQGVEGALLLMLSHGLVSPALFLLVGSLYDRHKTRLLKYYGGAAVTMPVFSIFFLFFTMANISLPGTSSFIGEFLVLTSTFNNNTFAAIIASTGMVLGAAYALLVCNRCLYGMPKRHYISYWSDLSRREVFMFIPLIILVLFMGVYPQVFLNSLQASVGNVLQQCLF